MTIRANVIATTTNNTTVFLDSVSGIVQEDIFVSNLILRERNVRVVSTFESNGAVVLNQKISIVSGNTAQFQKLVTGVGLIGSQTRISYFMRTGPSYDSAVDPRLPKTTRLAANLSSTATTVEIYGNVSTTGIYPVAIPHSAAETKYGSTILFNSTSDVEPGDYVLGNISGFVSNIRVVWVGNGNANIGLSKPISVTSGQSLLFRRPVQPAIRVGSETIYYSNTATDGTTMTLSDITRNIANTKPASDWVWPANTTVSILGSIPL